MFNEAKLTHHKCEEILFVSILVWSRLELGFVMEETCVGFLASFESNVEVKYRRVHPKWMKI